MVITINWGILGAGNISSQFVHDLCLNNTKADREVNHIVRSVGSSSVSKALSFIESNDVNESNNIGVTPHALNYEDFFKDEEIDVVYIGTPHPFHKDQAIQAIENGKHVLCEKPFTVNLKDSKELIEVAKKNKRFLMEAVWTRFFPSICALKKYLFVENLFGEVHRLFMDFAYDADVTNLPPTSRVRDVNLAGGALLDIGIYTLTYARILLDDKLGHNATKFDFKSFQTIDRQDKVDYVSSILLKYSNGKQAILTTSNLDEGTSPFLKLEGSKATLEMWSKNPACPKNYKITFRDGREPIVYTDDSGYNGFIYEANAVAKDISAGKLEDSIMPLDETLLIMDVMDRIRKESGLVFPQD